jgi:hypothetical protein
MWRRIRPLALSALVTGCGGESRDAAIDAAFERCIERARIELSANNPDAPAEVREVLDAAAHQTCEAAILATCSQDPDGDACRVILDVYGS